MHEASSVIQKAAHENANIIFGAVQDDAMKDTIKITVIAAGFKDARLRVDRTPQAQLRCRSLFSADLSVPGELPVAMSAPSAESTRSS